MTDTAAAEGDISKGKDLSYEETMGSFTSVLSKLNENVSQMYKVMLEEKEARKKKEGSEEDDEAKGKKKEEEVEEDEEEDEEDEDEEVLKAARAIAKRRALTQLKSKVKQARAGRATVVKAEDEAAQTAAKQKLEELRTKIEEVKARIEDARTKREAANKKVEAATPKAQGKGQLGEVKEEPKLGTIPSFDGSQPLPAYWAELFGASKKYKEAGFLGST